MRILTPLALVTFLLWVGDRNACFAQGKGKAKPDGEAKAAPATPFSTVVRANFKSWDLDGDGKLTLEEVEKGMINPHYKGDAAAAVATFRFIARYHYARHNKEMPPFTLDLLRAYEAAMAARRDPEDDFDRVFLEYQKKLANTPRELFPEKVPKLTAVKQGDIGDCWFMSMMGALVYLHPDRVCKMVEKGKGKHYLVHFDGLKQPVQAPEPTDAEVALYTSAEKNGLWVTVIEQAFAVQTNRKQLKAEHQLSPVDVLSGGYPSVAVAVLTGHGHRGVAPYFPKFEEELIAAVKDRCLMYTSGNAKNRTPGIVHGGHLYAVIDYDARAKLVTVFDPLGQDFTPKKGKESGLKVGYECKDGVMKLPLEEFKQVFTGIGCEDRTTKATEGKKKYKS